MSSVKIEFAGGAVGTKILVDGIEQKNTFDIEVRHRAGDIPKLTLKRYLTEAVTIEGQTDVEVQTICPKCRDIVKLETTVKDFSDVTDHDSKAVEVIPS